MKALVLAAGFGTRLLPLTQSLPKPMFPVMNRPVLEHTLALLQANGIEDIVINLHHLPEKIADHFGGGESYGVRLRYSREQSILGTAGGIKAAQKFLDGETFLVVNSDILVDIDLKKVVEFHEQKNALLTLVLRKDPHPEKFAPMETDQEGRIVLFPGASTPKAAGKTTRLMFTGVQVMGPEIFSRIPEQGFCGTTEDVFPKMIEEGLPVYGYPHDGYWQDLGCREDYLQAHRDILDGKMAITSGKNSLNFGDEGITPPVLIGANCRIAPQAKVGPYAVLGDGCRVEDGAVVEHSVCWANAVIGNGATVRDSIIATGVAVGDKQKIIGQSAVAR